jgi:hypothetical protein
MKVTHKKNIPKSKSCKTLITAHEKSQDDPIVANIITDRERRKKKKGRYLLQAS